MVSAEDLNLPVDQADKHLPTVVHLGKLNCGKSEMFGMRVTWQRGTAASKIWFMMLICFMVLITHLAEWGSRQHDPADLAPVLGVGACVKQDPPVVRRHPHL